MTPSTSELKQYFAKLLTSSRLEKKTSISKHLIGIGKSLTSSEAMELLEKELEKKKKKGRREARKKERERREEKAEKDKQRKCTSTTTENQSRAMCTECECTMI